MPKIADMHTHSLFSHDSVSPIEEMCLSQIQKGTNIFAVTDHCDVYLCKDYDVFTPIIKASLEAKELNKKYGDKCLILSGVEISEGFWFPEALEKIYTLADFDVIIGSVHCVRYENLTMPYSKIDFSVFSKTQIYEYLSCYFKDVKTLIETTDFDVLAHLTCPLRYINGKYKRDFDISVFADVIDEILKEVIKNNIALEVNTSSYELIGDFMPNIEIIKRYFNLGGRNITLGSDAHKSENASYSFPSALNTLKEIGFKEICYFKNRRKFKEKI